MRVLVIHNFYQQPGGEDAVFRAEVELLRGAGHDVRVFEIRNDEIEGYGAFEKAALAARTVWSRKSARALAKELERFRPDIAHFHNTFPLISPSAYYACRKAAVPVVQTLHNYRLSCPGATFFRNGEICEDCLGRAIPLPGLKHRCYRDSALASATVVAMLSAHRALGTWRRMVDVYVALTEFARSKMIEGGLPAERIVVKPNFLAEPPPARQGPGEHAIFIGRLAPEKGLATLMRAWDELAVPLRIYGDGPLAAEVREWAGRRPNADVQVLGWRPAAEVLASLSLSRCLVFPSQWYEGFPMTAVEALACGVPIVAGDLGSLGEIVEHGVNGRKFEPRDSRALALSVQGLFDDAAEAERLGHGARESFERAYTAEANLEALLAVYERAVASARDRASR